MEILKSRCWYSHPWLLSTQYVLYVLTDFHLNRQDGDASTRLTIRSTEYGVLRIENVKADTLLVLVHLHGFLTVTSSVGFTRTSQIIETNHSAVNKAYPRTLASGSVQHLFQQRGNRDRVILSSQTSGPDTERSHGGRGVSAIDRKR